MFVCLDHILDKSSRCLFTSLPDGKLLSPQFINQQDTSASHFIPNPDLCLSRDTQEWICLKEYSSIEVSINKVCVGDRGVWPSSVPIMYWRMTDEDRWARLEGKRLRGHMRESGLVNIDKSSGITSLGAKGSSAQSQCIFIRPCVADEPKQHLVTRLCLVDVHDLVSSEGVQIRNTRLCITVVFCLWTSLIFWTFSLWSLLGELACVCVLISHRGLV